MHPVSFSLSDFLHLAPALVLFVFAVAVMMIEAVVRPERKTGLWALTLGGLGLAGLASLALYADAAPYDIQGMARVDRFGLFFQLVTILSGGFATLMSDDYLERLSIRVGEYYALVLFGVLGMGLMGFASDLIMVFIALEIMSISMYVLCALNRGSAASVESGFKYFILGAFSSALMLYGISLVYGATGHTGFAGIATALKDGTLTSGPILGAGVVLLFVGFGFKVGAVPFHSWAPDVYQGAPTSVTALMSSGVKAASFAAFVRLVVGVLGVHADGWAGALWWMAALTMVVGNLGALAQRDLKRMLAYSSIAHAGYLLMALSSSGYGGSHSEAMSSILFYLVAYTFMNAGAFAVLSMLTDAAGDAVDIDSLAGLGRSHPMLAAGLSVCMLSLAGIPPTMGFVGKFYLFTAAVQSGEIGLAMIGALAAASGVYYYLRPMVYMYMREGEPEVHASRATMVGLSLSVVATLALGMMPAGMLGWAAESLATLFTPV